MRTRIKFCGCTSPADARMAVELGADAVGVIFAPESPRCVDTSTAAAIRTVVPPFVVLVGVVVDPSPVKIADLQARGFLPQFSGDEPAALCELARGTYIKVHHMAPAIAVSAAAAGAFDASATAYTQATWMFDTAVDGKRGGTGRAFAWESARALAGDRRIIVSGGLTPLNVAECIRRIRPYAVDVRSGIETDGVKDPRKMSAFVRAVEEADAQT